MNRLRGTRVDASHFCKLRVILLLPKASGEGSEDGSTYLLPSTPPTSCSPPSPPSSAPATNVGGGLGQQDLRAAGLSSKGTYDCEFPPKLSVEQIKVRYRPLFAFIFFLKIISLFVHFPFFFLHFFLHNQLKQGKSYPNRSSYSPSHPKRA